MAAVTAVIALTLVVSASGITSAGGDTDRVQFIRFDNDSVCVTLSEEEIPLYSMEVRTADLVNGPYRTAGSNTNGFVFVDDIGYQGTYLKVRINDGGKWTEFKPMFVAPLGDAGYVTSVSDATSTISEPTKAIGSAVEVTLTPPESLPIGGYLNFTYKEKDSEGEFRTAVTSAGQGRTLAGAPVSALIDDLKPDTDYVFQIRLMNFDTGRQVLAFSPVYYRTPDRLAETVKNVPAVSYSNAYAPEIVKIPDVSAERYYSGNLG